MADKLKKKLEAVSDMRSQIQVRCRPSCGVPTAHIPPSVLSGFYFVVTGSGKPGPNVARRECSVGKQIHGIIPLQELDVGNSRRRSR